VAGFEKDVPVYECTNKMRGSRYLWSTTNTLGDIGTYCVGLMGASGETPALLHWSVPDAEKTFNQFPVISSVVNFALAVVSPPLFSPLRPPLQRPP
jgi:outer membrane protein assembly factor BamB